MVGHHDHSAYGIGQVIMRHSAAYGSGMINHIFAGGSPLPLQKAKPPDHFPVVEQLHQAGGNVGQTLEVYL